MAIDTTNEKLALIEYGDIFQPGIPISADGLDQADNQQLLWGYPGILWTVVEIITTTVSYRFHSGLTRPKFHSGLTRPKFHSGLTRPKFHSGL